MTDHQKALVLQFKPLAHYWVNKMSPWRMKRYEYEELEGVALLALVRAAKGFEEGRGCTFMTYASRSIMNEVRDQIRDLLNNQMTRCPTRAIIPQKIVRITRHCNGDEFQYIQESPVEDHSQEFLELCEDFREREILRLHCIEGASIREISRRIGLSRERVRQIYIKCTERLRSKLNPDGTTKKEIATSSHGTGLHQCSGREV